MQRKYPNRQDGAMEDVLEGFSEDEELVRRISWDKVKQACARANSILDRIFTILIIAGGALVALAVVLQVVLRYIFKAPLFGLEEFSLLVAIWVYFLGAILGTEFDAHVQGDVAARFFRTARSRAVVKVITWALSCTACTLFLYHSSTYTLWVYETGERTTGLWWPRVISVGSMFFGAVFMTLYCVVNMVKYGEAAIAAGRHD